MISTWLSDCRLLTSRCTVEDGSGQALIFMSGDCCRNWLKLPPNVWKVLEETVLPHEGEFLYFSSVSWSMTMSVVFSLPPKTRTLVQSCREWLVWLIITNCVTSEIASSSRQFGLSNLILLLRHVLPLETALARYRRQVRQQRRYVDQSTISLFTPLDLLYTSWFSFLKRRHFCRPISLFYVKSIQPDKSGQQLISSRINHRGGSFACTSANWIQPSVPTSYQVNKRSSPITHTHTHIHFARPSRGLPSQRLPLFDDKSFVPSASSVCLWQGRLLFCHHRRRRRRFYSFIFPFSSFWKKQGAFPVWLFIYVRDWLPFLIQPLRAPRWICASTNKRPLFTQPLGFCSPLYPPLTCKSPFSSHKTEEGKENNVKTVQLVIR